jgi:prepilin-type N-terminal cleavage/methylation domain-containing protein
MLVEVMKPPRIAPPVRGFTLIEMFVAVAILAIVLGLGLPSLRDWMIAQRVSSVATELATDMRYARSDAVSTNIGAGVVFGTVGKGCYTVFRGPADRIFSCNCNNTPACPPAVAPNPPVLTELKTVLLPGNGDVSLTTTAVNPELYRAGAMVANEGTGVVININGGSTRTLRVVTSTGLHFPTVCKPSGSTIPGFKEC